MKKSISSIGIFLVLISLNSPVMTFSGVAQALIAIIAEDYIRELDSYPQILEVMQIMKPYTREKDYMFVESAVWLEDIYFKNSWYAFQSWGFSNNYLYAKSGKNSAPQSFEFLDKSRFSSLGYKVAEPSITSAIDMAVKSLVHHKNAPMDDHFAKSMNLRTLINLVCKIHQPLRMGSLFSLSNPAKTVNAFGSMFKLKSDKYQSLYLAWEYAFDTFPLFDVPYSKADYEAMVQIASELTSGFDFEADESGDKRTLNLDKNDWLSESLQILKNFVYVGIRPNEKLSSEYVTRAVDIIKNQIVVAGVRLGKLLVQIFEDESVIARHVGDRILEGKGAEQESKNVSGSGQANQTHEKIEIDSKPDTNKENPVQDTHTTEDESSKRANELDTSETVNEKSNPKMSAMLVPRKESLLFLALKLCSLHL